MLYKRFFKRPFDLFFGLVAFFILWPFYVAIAILIRLKVGKPILFRQQRPGLNEKLFTLYKFRTMTDERDESGNLLQDEIRLTKFGKFLRSTSLDELPELINILKGEMSFVGPRPLLKEYLPLYSKEQARRHEEKPGLTGWAQINGRNAISWQKKFELDIMYVDNLSFLLDMKIIFLTIIKVFQRKGISQDNHVTMEYFKGNN